MSEPESIIDYWQRRGYRDLCDRCDGTGEHVFPFSSLTCKCSHCNGTGQKPVGKSAALPNEVTK